MASVVSDEKFCQFKTVDCLLSLLCHYSQLIDESTFYVALYFMEQGLNRFATL